MKEDTKILLTKLSEIHFKENIFKPVKLTNEGTALMKHIFRTLDSIHEVWEIRKHTIFSQIKPLSELPISDDYSFIPAKIRRDIEVACKYYVSCSFTFHERIFTVFLCSQTQNEDFTKKAIQRIYLWLSMASEHVKSSCSKTVNLYFYFIDNKKEIPTKANEPIDLVHVNTAFTTGCQPHTNVHVFREEEWFRALIHESFHNLGLDFLQLNQRIQNQMESRIRAIFPMKIDDIRFNETYCEMWAEVLNLIFIIYLSESSSSSRKINHMMSLLKKMLFFEGMFSSWQCVKLLNANNLLYEQLFDEKHASSYKEKTQGFSYYVLKSIYMVHVSQFIHFCAFSPDYFHFQLTSESANRYTQIVEDNHHSVKFLNGIKAMEKEIPSASGFWKKTLRMSLFEEDI